MKKYLFLLLYIIATIFLLNGCSDKVINNGVSTSKDNSVSVDKQNPVIENNQVTEKNQLDKKEESNAEDDISDIKQNEDSVNELIKEVSLNFREELLKLKLKRNPYWEDGDPTQTEWVKKWLEFTYKDVDLTNVKTKRIANYIMDVNNGLTLRLEKIFVQFNSENKIDGLELNEDNMYTDQIYMIFAEVRENNEPYQYFLDVISNDELDNIGIFDYAINVLANDDRFKKDIDIGSIFRKENVLAEGVKLFDRDKILDGYSLYALNEKDNNIVFLMGKPNKIDENGVLLYNLKICNYDYNNHIITNTIDIENQESSNYYGYYDDGFAFGIGRKIIDFEGNISTIDDKEIKYVYSPDTKFYAYTDEKHNLIVKNINNDEAIITLESVTDENPDTKISDYNGYGVYGWIDNENIIYTMTGYEWSNGFGIVNVSTGENITFNDSRGKNIYKLINGKLYSGIFGYYGETFPYNFGYYDLNTLPYSYTEVYNAEDNRKIYENEGAYLEYSRRLSSDLSNLYIFAFNPENSEYFVKTLSVESVDIIKETRFKISEYLQPGYMDASFILNDKVLIILDRYNLYFIDI